MQIFVGLCLSRYLRRQCWMCCKGEFQTVRCFLVGFLGGITASQSNTRKKSIFYNRWQFINVLVSNILLQVQTTGLVYHWWPAVSQQFGALAGFCLNSRDSVGTQRNFSACEQRCKQTRASYWSENLHSMISLYAVKPGMCLIIDGYECPEYQRYFQRGNIKNT